MRVFVVLWIGIFVVSALCTNEEGTRRRDHLLDRVKNSENGLITFTPQDYQQYAMKYPRPYDIVIYFTYHDGKLAKQLQSQFQYVVELYHKNGLTTDTRYPVFFVQINFSKSDREISKIFKSFGFDTVPNIAVLKPYAAVVHEAEKDDYLKHFKWRISITDGHVTAHKLLQFVNKRTGKEVEYSPRDESVKQMVLGFIGAAIAAVLIYKLLRPIWTHWLFWLLCSIAAYFVCCSGLIYCILNDVPYFDRQGNMFSKQNRSQTASEGWIISGVISGIGILLILVGIAGTKCQTSYSTIICIASLLLVWLGVKYLQSVFKSKGWYKPSFYPPDNYLKGPFHVDQGNNIYIIQYKQVSSKKSFYHQLNRATS